MLRECRSTEQYRINPAHLRDLDIYLARIPRQQVDAMREQINREADRTGYRSDDYFASSWGKHDWSEYAGGVFEPLYKAIGDERVAALNLSTLIMREISARGDRWVFSHDAEAATDACPRDMWGSFYWRADRRRQLRKVPQELFFIQVEQDDGGRVLNISEGGLCFELFSYVPQTQIVPFWFSLNLRDRLEALGLITWVDAKKMVGGLDFLHLNQHARDQIRAWMRESSTADSSAAIPEPVQLHPSAISPVSRRELGHANAATPLSARTPDTVPSSGNAGAPGKGIFESFNGTEAGARTVFFRGVFVGALASLLLAIAVFRYANSAHPVFGRSPDQANVASPVAQTGPEAPATPEQLWASVQAGNAKAAVLLADLYLRGDGVPLNCAQARVLLVVASDKNNQDAIKKLRDLDKTGCPPTRIQSTTDRNSP